MSRCKTIWVLALALAATVQAQDLAVRGEKVYTVSGAAIDDGVVVIRDGRIVAVGPASEISVPAGMVVLEAAVVTPGLVDAHTTVGLSGVQNASAGQVRDQDQLEKSAPLQPDLRAIDAYNTQDGLVEWVRQFGVTTMHTGHGPGAVISGQTMIVKPWGKTVEDAIVVEERAVAATLGASVSSNFKSPGTRAKSVAMLRQALIDAEAYREKQADAEKAGPRDLSKETLARVLDGELALMLTAHTVTDIAAALRLKEEFGIDLWLDGASEAYLIAERVAAAEVPVLLHAPMMRAGGETKNAAIDSSRRLQEAGLTYAIQTGFEGYVPKSRVLLFEASVAAANGLAFDDVLRAITLTPAEILGVDDRVGSLEVGKDGDLALFSGDPFEYTEQICAVVIEGVIVSDQCW